MTERPAAAAPTNPYIGPTPFDYDERDRFFGRDLEIRELTSLIVAHREVVLYAQSGAGKTSLLRAGVCPRLVERGFEVLPPGRVVGPPLDRATKDGIRNVYTYNLLADWARKGVGEAPGPSETLKEFLARISVAGAPPRRLRIVILDQFEELFTTSLDRWKDRAQFLAQVAEALEADRTLRVLFALREEYLGRLKRFGELFRDNLNQWFHLERLREHAALEAITRPAAQAHRPYSPAVAAAIVQQLLPIRIKAEDGGVDFVPGEFVEPVHLQIVCKRLWDRLHDRHEKISPADVVTHGDVSTALQEYYEFQIATVSRETSIAVRKLLRWFERRFISDDGRRARVFERNGAVGGQPLAIAIRFQQAYLLRSDSQDDTVWFELAHDRLVTAVQMARKGSRRRLLALQSTAAALLVVLGFASGLIYYRRSLDEQLRSQTTVAIRIEGASTAPTESPIASSPSDTEVITIPVVVHVVYNTDEENISDAQIDSQFVVLNEDFRARNATLKNVPKPFQPLIADAHIQFVKATVDPDGNSTGGVTRTKTKTTAFSTADRMKHASTGGADAWPSSRYLNIWVTELSGGLLEYSQFPGGAPETDGVVLSYVIFGTIGTVKPPFHLGHGAAHAIGHFLNLNHIWGDTSDCSGTDHVADTPAQGPNFGMPVFPHVSCNNGPNGDMFMNFMDYSDDAALAMFTKGQVDRMRETLGKIRRDLWKR